MTWAEFEEKEYEIAAAVEIAAGPTGYGSIFSSGQVLERLLGYDGATAPPDDHVIWRILAVPRPRGVVLVQGHWEAGRRPPASSLPQSPVSLILQYKRPEYLYGPTAKQWKLWYEPYLRFKCERRQQAVLIRLERRLGSDALVRYASAAFWRRGDLEAAILRRSVLAQTGFVAPRRLHGHRVWTFVAPGQDGRPNPRGRASRFETFADLVREWAAPATGVSGSSELVQTDRLNAHLELVARAAREHEPRLRPRVERWARVARQAVPDVPAQVWTGVVNLATIVTVVGAYGATWYLV